MEPRIQYAKTSDGLSIAFWTLGEGPPLVYMPPSLNSHIQLEWQWPQRRAFHSTLAEGRLLVRYDGRGSGLSDENVEPLSLDSRLLDFDAVVDALQLERFSLLAPIFFGPPAIAYAARHPNRVSHLILWHAYVRGSDLVQSRRELSLHELSDTDWELATETMARLRSGFPTWSRREGTLS